MANKGKSVDLRRKDSYEAPTDPKELIKYNIEFLANRPIAEGKRVVHNGIPGLMDKFKAMKWESFLLLNGPIRPSLVREFYANFRFTGDTVYFNLEGHDFMYPLKDFGVIMDVPTKGQQFYNVQHNLSNLPTFISNHLSVIDTLCVDGVDREEILNTGVMSKHIRPEYEDWSKVISHNVMCKSGNLSHINATQVALMWCLDNEIDVDIAYLMASRMSGLITETTRGLPYGMHLNLLFDALGIQSNNTRPPKNAFIRKSNNANAPAPKRQRTSAGEGSSRGGIVISDSEREEEENPPTEELGQNEILDIIYQKQGKSLKKESKMKKLLKGMFKSLTCGSSDEEDDKSEES